ncbi:MAG: phosphoglucosamine mutase [Pseudomonadota bacterium]|nr:phosphoglucosamine mutase [Pseudomonadota bacterium]
MARKYFGTDGIRGRVGEHPINAEFMLKLGWATGRVLGNGTATRVVIGKDTRISGYMFESALEAGLSAAGVDIRLLGPMPTPGIAYLTRTMHACAGIVISASHNPHHDNGIKFFSAQGTKLPAEVEAAIEAELENPMRTVSSEKLGKAERVEDARGRYIEFCKSTIPSRISLRGLKIVIDCANGATYQVAPSVLEEMGADVIAIGVEPNGLNINEECGSTLPKLLCERVLKEGADLGIALDGDGDRVIMVDHKGELVDGDELLFIIAASRKENEQLSGPVVGTLMTNLGLEHALSQLDIAFKRASVGDRYVMEMLNEHGGVVGGESSGHIICLDRTSTGDGMVSALQVLATMIQKNVGLHELKQGMKKYPQCMINIPLVRHLDVNNSEPIQSAVRRAETHLNGKGRVLLRSSGTEPLIRVMVEGEDEALVRQQAKLLAEIVEHAITGHAESA